MADETTNNNSESVSPNLDALLNLASEILSKLDSASEVARGYEKRQTEMVRELRELSKAAKSGRDKELLKIVSQIQRTHGTFTADFIRKFHESSNRDNLTRELLNWLKSSKNNTPPTAGNAYGSVLQFMAKYLGVNSAYASTWSTAQHNLALRGIQAARGTPMEQTLRAYDSLYNLTHAKNNYQMLFHAGKGIYHGVKGWMQGSADAAAAAGGAARAAGGAAARAGGAAAASAGGAAAAGATAGAAAGGIIGAIALAAAMYALQKTLEKVGDQVTKGWKENKDALLGDAFVYSRMAMGAGGNFQMFGDVGFNSRDYLLYRSGMRRRGLRDEDQIAGMLMSFTGAGFNVRDAAAMATDVQSLRQRMGLTLDAEFLRRMYVGTQTSRGSFFSKGDGSFGVGGLVTAMGAVAKRSETDAGVRLGIGSQARIVDAITKDMLGMGNSIETVVAALDKFSKQLTTGKLTTQEFINMFNGFNEMSSQNRLNLIAMNPNRTGSIAQDYYNMVARSRDASGRVTNWQENSRTLLNVLRRNSDGTDADAFFKGTVGGIFDMFGGSALNNNPHAMELLSEAASGNKDAIKELTRISETEKDVLTKQAATLDAIRRPMEHVRDWLFTLPVSFLPGIGSHAAASWNLQRVEANRLGLSGQSREDYLKYAQAKEEEDVKTERMALSENIKALTDITKDSHEWMQRLADALDGNKVAVQENTEKQGSSGGRKAVGNYY